MSLSMHMHNLDIFSERVPKILNGNKIMMDGRMDGQTDGGTDGQNDRIAGL